MTLVHRVQQLRGRLPARVLGPLAVALLLLWGFVELADEVLEGATHATDEWILRRLRTGDLSDPIGPVWFEEMARDVTALGGTVVLGLLVAVTSAYLALNRRVRTSLFVLSSIGLGFVTIHLLKWGFDRPRPELVADQAVYTSSFPSGHSMASALTFLTLAAMLARTEARRRVQVFLLVVALLLTGLVGVSRVYLGVHYPTDVLGGWGVGAAWAALAWLAQDALTRRGLLGE